MDITNSVSFCPLIVAVISAIPCPSTPRDAVLLRFTILVKRELSMGFYLVPPTIMALTYGSEKELGDSESDKYINSRYTSKR